jgi:DNA polymerase I-like protein with 3'-5' exonuclease and polymerase domains
MIHSDDSGVRSKSERQAINAPVQSTLSDLTIYSLSKVEEEYGNNDAYRKECKFHCFTHDDLKAYVQRDRIMYWGPRIKEIMESLPYDSEFGWKPALKFLVDIEVGGDWASLVKWHHYLATQKADITG